MTALTPMTRVALALACSAALAHSAQAQQHAHSSPPAATATEKPHAMDHAGMDHSMTGPSGSQPPKAEQAETKQSRTDHSATGHAQMSRSTEKPAATDHAGMDHSMMDHSRMEDSANEPRKAERAGAKPSGMDHSSMDHSSMSSMQTSKSSGAADPGKGTTAPREPIPPVTQAERDAAFSPLSHQMTHASSINSYVLFNRLETGDAKHGSAQSWEGLAWIGNDTDRLWLRSEGEREDGRTESADLEVLYGRSLSPWWDLVVGAKQDVRPGPSRTWAAIGVQGLSPYKFEVQATAYLGDSGHTALNLEAEYELLLTNRLILQPLVELELRGRDDPRRGTGSGLSTAEAGLRLRYEVTRQFAPYVGVTWERAFGGTADARREHGDAIDDTRFVAGLRFWF